MGLEHN